MSTTDEQLAKATDHLQTSYIFIEQAEEELGRGDILQASEKAWGAAVHVVKAASVQRRWKHGKYGPLRENVQRIADECDDAELPSLFRLANSLHRNFYEDSLDEKDVRESIGDVRLFLEKIEKHIFSV